MSLIVIRDHSSNIVIRHGSHATIDDGSFGQPPPDEGVELPIEMTDVNGLPDALSARALATAVDDALADKENVGVAQALVEALTAADVGAATPADIVTALASLTAEDVGAATAADIAQAIDVLVAGAPAALDTLLEIADKLADNDDVVSALVAQIVGKENTGVAADLVNQLETNLMVIIEKNTDQVIPLGMLHLTNVNLAEPHFVGAFLQPNVRQIELVGQWNPEENGTYYTPADPINEPLVRAPDNEQALRPPSEGDPGTGGRLVTFSAVVSGFRVWAGAYEFLVQQVNGIVVLGLPQGQSIPMSTRHTGYGGDPIDSDGALQPGDLVFLPDGEAQAGFVFVEDGQPATQVAIATMAGCRVFVVDEQTEYVHLPEHGWVSMADTTGPVGIRATSDTPTILIDHEELTGETERNLQLWPDGSACGFFTRGGVTYMAAPGGRVFSGTAHHTAITKVVNGDPAVDGVVKDILGAPSSARMVAGGPIHDTGTDLYMILHIEEDLIDVGGPQYQYLGVAKSEDDGDTWTYVSDLVTPEMTREALAPGSSTGDSGPGPFVVKDGYLYFVYSETLLTSESFLALGRVLETTLLAGAPVFEKWTGDSWVVGGTAASIPFPEGFDTHGQAYDLIEIGRDGNRWGLLSASTTGVGTVLVQTTDLTDWSHAPAMMVHRPGGREELYRTFYSGDPAHPKRFVDGGVLWTTDAQFDDRWVDNKLGLYELESDLFQMDTRRFQSSGANILFGEDDIQKKGSGTHYAIFKDLTYPLPSLFSLPKGFYLVVNKTAAIDPGPITISDPNGININGDPTPFVLQPGEAALFTAPSESTNWIGDVIVRAAEEFPSGILLPLFRETLSADGAFDLSGVDLTGVTELQIRVSGRMAGTGGAVGIVGIRFNGDTGSNYFVNNAAATTAFVHGTLPASQTTADKTGYWELVMMLGGVGKQSVGIQRGAPWASTATVGISPEQRSFYYGNVSAPITSLDVYAASQGPFAAGTRLEILGRK